MYYQEMNSISFKASVQILYIVLCNYCTTCIIYRDKIKFKLTTNRRKMFLRTYAAKYFHFEIMSKTLHTVCFMHGLSINEIKRIYHRVYFS